jgi:hypothetical protein
MYFTAKKLKNFVTVFWVVLNVAQYTDLVKMASAIGNSITCYRRECTATVKEISV